jgi:molecular chaperone HtpG
VLERLKTALKDRAKDVRTTTRLVDSPACIVVDEGDMSGAPGAAAQAGRADGAPSRMPILEVNAEHALVKRLESEGERASTTWRRSCSTRPCWPKAATSKTLRPMCGA